MPDYETLRVIWWLILGALLIGFAIMDGFDLGVGAIFRFLGRTDEERRALLESVEPVWEGNQVWFILGGGAVFAAWPLLYAASFSSLYLAMFLLLVALILRPVGFTFRNKIAGSALAQLLGLGLTDRRRGAGAAVRRRVRQSVSRRAVSLRRADASGLYRAASSICCSPFALLAGVVSVSMLVMHGAAYAALKVGEPMSSRAASVGARGGGGVRDRIRRCRRLAGERHRWPAHRLGGRPARAVQSAAEDGGGGPRGVARQLPRARAAVARAVARDPRGHHYRPAAAPGPARDRVRVQLRSRWRQRS